MDGEGEDAEAEAWDGVPGSSNSWKVGNSWAVEQTTNYATSSSLSPPSSPSSNSGASLPCSSRVVDAAVRGGFHGLVWVVVNPKVNFVELIRPVLHEEAWQGLRGPVNTVRLFVLFHGGYAGASCVASAVLQRPSDHWTSSTFGGLVGGALLGAHTRKVKVMSLSAGVTAASAAAIRIISSVFDR